MLTKHSLALLKQFFSQQAGTIAALLPFSGWKTERKSQKSAVMFAVHG